MNGENSGFLWHPDKSIWEPLQQGADVLEFLDDFRKGYFHVPERRITCQQQIDKFYNVNLICPRHSPYKRDNSVYESSSIRTSGRFIDKRIIQVYHASQHLERAQQTLRGCNESYFLKQQFWDLSTQNSRSSHIPSSFINLACNYELSGCQESLTRRLMSCPAKYTSTTTCLTHIT